MRPTALGTPSLVPTTPLGEFASPKRVHGLLGGWGGSYRHSLGLGTVPEPSLDAALEGSFPLRVQWGCSPVVLGWDAAAAQGGGAGPQPCRVSWGHRAETWGSGCVRSSLLQPPAAGTSLEVEARNSPKLIPTLNRLTDPDTVPLPSQRPRRPSPSDTRAGERAELLNITKRKCLAPLSQAFFWSGPRILTTAVLNQPQVRGPSGRRPGWGSEEGLFCPRSVAPPRKLEEVPSPLLGN